MDECKLRALKYLATLDTQSLASAGQVGYTIWPEARNMTGQGAGLIGSKILKLLKDDNLVRWDHRRIGRFVDWGWQITPTGREHLKFLEGQYNA
jgi:hypothetical protein